MPNFHDRFQDMDEYEVQGEISQFLWDDNADQLLELLDYLYRRGGNDFDWSPGKALAYACSTGAAKCVDALINGINGRQQLHHLVVDIHSPCYKSLFPLHYAAQSGHPAVTELLLYHGARTDVRCNFSDITDHYIAYYRCRNIIKEIGDHPRNLPLHVALNRLWCCKHVKDWDFSWKPKLCTPQLLCVLSLPFMRNLLETIGLLAWKTGDQRGISAFC